MKGNCQPQHPSYGLGRAEQQPGGASGQTEEKCRAEQRQDKLDEDRTGDLRPLEQRAEDQGLPGDSITIASASANISSRYTQLTTQPLTIPRAVARYVECPVSNDNVQLLTDNITGTSQIEAQGQAEQTHNEICHTGQPSYRTDRTEQQLGGDNGQGTSDVRGQAEQCQAEKDEMARSILDDIVRRMFSFCRIKKFILWDSPTK